MIANGYDDITKCLGLDPRAMFQVFLQESAFMPTALNVPDRRTGRGTTAHGIGQYIVGTLNGHQNQFQKLMNFIDRRDQPPSQATTATNDPGGDASNRTSGAHEACGRVRNILGPVPAFRGENNRTICSTVTNPAHMVSNMMYGVLDHAMFKEQFRPLLANCSGISPTDKEFILQQVAYLGHHDGPGKAKNKLLKFLDGACNVQVRRARREEFLSQMTQLAKSNDDHDFLTAIRATATKFNEGIKAKFPGTSCL